MNQLYLISSPSGARLKLFAESFYHAIQLAITQEGGRYSVAQYFRLNRV